MANFIATLWISVETGADEAWLLLQCMCRSKRKVAGSMELFWDSRRWGLFLSRVEPCRMFVVHVFFGLQLAGTSVCVGGFDSA
jgi:hypothetical protein